MLAEYARKVADYHAEGYASWHYGHAGLFLAEYAVATRDPAVMPGLRRIAKEIAAGQSAVGTWGHKFARPSGNCNGYGCMNLTGKNYDVKENVFMTGHGGVLYGTKNVQGYQGDRNLFWNAEAGDRGCETYRGERPAATGWPENVESGEPWRPLVTEVFTEWGLEDEIDRAVAVLACESHGDPFINNPNHPQGGGVWGLFQHWDVAWENRSTAAGIPGASPLDARSNATVAAWLVKESIEEPHANGPWGHWACGLLLGYWPEDEG